MNFSIVLIYLPVVFGFCFLINRRARRERVIAHTEATAIYMLIGAFAIWTAVLIAMGVQGLHLELMLEIPFLWQAFVPVTLWMLALGFPAVRRGLNGIALATPDRWFYAIQALRIGAIGGVTKGFIGAIQSDYVFWVGIPDLLFGISALLLFLLNRPLGSKFLITWNFIGAGLILLPTFIVMNYWMAEQGFQFIFEFPMVLAPGIVVSLLVSLNFMHAWGAFIRQRQTR